MGFGFVKSNPILYVKHHRLIRCNFPIKSGVLTGWKELDHPSAISTSRVYFNVKTVRIKYSNDSASCSVARLES